MKQLSRKKPQSGSQFDQKSLLFRFQKYIRAHQFFEKRRRILIACSGGADSTALFHLLRLTLSEKSHQLVLVHFNHGIRARTAKRDELFVKKMARQYEVPFFAGRTNLSGKSRGKFSLEEAARIRRYAFFQSLYRRRKMDALVFAHHLDDQAETILMRVCQGTGLRGLLGIRETMRMQNMHVIRPLLAFSKTEMVEFLRQNRFAFCRDETNQTSVYLRNRIRREVMPFLAKKINPRILQALSRIPETLNTENDLIERLEKKAVGEVVLSRSPRRVVLNAGAFRKLHPALQFRVLDGCLKKLDPAAGLLYEHWQSLQKQPEKMKRLSLPRGLEMMMHPGKKKLLLCRKI